MKYKIISQTKRGSHYEIMYDLLTDDNVLIVGGLQRRVGVKPLTKLEIEGYMVELWLPQHEEKEPTVEERQKAEVEEYLRSTGCLKENEPLESIKEVSRG